MELNEENLSVEISNADDSFDGKNVSVTTLPSNVHSDFQKSLHSPKTNALYQRKEALKGFVLSKLSKKPSTGFDTNNLNVNEIERRTIFSGIKEKLAKKLEDSSGKDTLPHSNHEEVEKSDTSSEMGIDLNTKKECELKLLVANDRGEGFDIDEAEECFEEMKQISEKYSLPSAHENHSSLIFRTSKSQTISNMTEISNDVVHCVLNTDKTFSVSYSNLHKVDDSNEVNESNVTENSSASIQETSLNSSIPLILHNSSDQTINVDSKPTPEVTNFRTCVQKVWWNFYNLYFKITYIFVIVLAIIIYWLIQNNCLFLAGLLCGTGIFTILFLLLQDFTTFTSENDVHFPNYKTLPPLTVPVSPVLYDEIHEGWMNQLIGEYDPETFKLSNTTSVFISLKKDILYISYPKKEIPKRAMWNENLPTLNPFILQNKFNLLGAKISLPPENLPHKRLWSKRYPLRIVLAKEPGLKRSPSMDCSSLAQEKSLPLPLKEPSVHSLPSSLSGSPVHNSQIYHFFARTDREKEEWYWNFMCAIYDKRDSYEVVKDIADEMVNSNSFMEGKKNILTMQTEKVKICNQKPLLHFADYMNFLMKSLPCVEEENINLSDGKSLQWLNVFIGRLFFDFLTQEKWHNYMKDKIQHKLSRLKMPQYVQDLIVTDVYLGTSLPQIQRTSQPVLNNRGFWLDLDIEYSGSFQVTLATKIKLAKKLEDNDEIKEETSQHPLSHSSCNSSRDDEYADLSSDDEYDLPDSEVSKDESLPSAKSPIHQSSTSNRLLLTVERWVSTSQNKFVQKCVGHLTQTPILLTLEVSVLCGTLAVNIPPLPTDRIWYGFRKKPQFSFKVYPKVGERHINYTPITKYIEKKLLLEFEKAIVLPNMDEILVPFMHSPVYDD